MIVRAAPPEHFPWLIERTHAGVTAGLRAIEAVDALGRIHAMVGYDLWTPNSVQMHVCIENPAALRSILEPAFIYPFVQCNRAVVVGVTPGDNEAALTLNRRVGFTVVHRVRDGWNPGVDMVIQEMRREECRWIQQARRAA